MSLLKELRQNVQPGPMYEDGNGTFKFDGLPVRVIAFYLPQFHSIPENDLWWGKGFTEWTNVTKSFPRFRGHYQPHLPGELGFYNLRDPEVLYRQAAMARQYGLHGFCIHHYWFAGKPLLYEPLEILLKHRDIDINFCLNWANESWSRRWNGSEKDLLIEQKYSAADDLALARSLEKVISDPRYIRIDGRPLLMIYRPGLLPDVRSTLDRWRNHFEREGMGNPYIIMPQAFQSSDPREFGMDAAAGFPPHVYGFANPRIRRYFLRLANPTHTSAVLSYDAMVQKALATDPSGYTLLPGVSPGFDNHPRNQNGTVFYGSTPAKYGQWLRAACEAAMKRNTPSEQIVFVNAWNEWAEGAHLEPDRHFGYAYLGETGRVLSSLCSKSLRSEVACV